VAYRGGGPAITARREDEAVLNFVPMPATMTSVHNGRLKTLTVSSATHSGAPGPHGPLIKQCKIVDVLNRLFGNTDDIGHLRRRQVFFYYSSMTKSTLTPTCHRLERSRSG